MLLMVPSRQILAPGRPDLTSWGRLEMTSKGRLNLTFKGRPREVDSGIIRLTKSI